jgi:hypothetical protein
LQRNSSTGIADGSVPAFTFVVSEPQAPTTQTFCAPQQFSADVGVQRDSSGSAFSDLPLTMAASYSSFSVPESLAMPPRELQSSRSNKAKDGGHLGRVVRYSTGDKGKVHEKLHECRHCLKRFNRPSSLRIHANTHTGARREWLCDTPLRVMPY